MQNFKSEASVIGMLMSQTANFLLSRMTHISQLLRVSQFVRKESVPGGKTTGAWGPSVSPPGGEITVDAEVLSTGLHYPQQNQRPLARSQVGAGQFREYFVQRVVQAHPLIHTSSNTQRKHIYPAFYRGRGNPLAK